MPIIPKDQVIGYFVIGGYECTKCFEINHETAAIKLDEVITEKNKNDDEMMFCDRCKEQIY